MWCHVTNHVIAVWATVTVTCDKSCDWMKECDDLVWRDKARLLGISEAIGVDAVPLTTAKVGPGIYSNIPNYNIIPFLRLFVSKSSKES